MAISEPWHYQYGDPYTVPGQYQYWITAPKTQSITRLGWECPKCNHVYSPDVSECLHCPTVTTTINGNNTYPLVNLVETVA